MVAKSMEKFREMDANELSIQEHELGEQIFRLRFQLTTGQAESVKKLREARRDLARVKTLAREQELGLRSAAPAKESGAAKSEKSEAKPRAAASEKKPNKKKSEAKSK
jgi:large subunit ribosomal protein L29